MFTTSFQPAAKRPVAAVLLAGVVLSACSSNQVQPDRPVSGVRGHTDQPSHSAPAPASSGSAGAANACAALAGAAVGKEADPAASSPGKLVSPPAACAAVADTSHSGACKAAGSGHWFLFTSKGYTVFGKPGATWQVKHGAFDAKTDLVKIGC